jgi:predicted porin
MQFNPSQIALVAAAALCSVGAQAQQQPGVEIYGQVGLSITSKNHQTATNASLNEVSTNSINVSHLGFRGREDLGNGLAAVFRMEASLAPDTGAIGKANGTFFDRQSFVGLSSKDLGAVTVGRQFHALTDRTIRTLDVYQVGPANAHIVPLALYGVNRYSANDNRASNSIKYRFDQPTGFQAGLSYALGEVSGSSSKGSSYSFDLAYVGSDFNVGAGLVSFNGLNTLGTTTILPKHEVWSVGGSMKFGAITPYLSYYNSTLDSATTPGLKTQQNKITSAGVAWNAAPAILLRGGYYTDKGTDLNNVTGRNGKKDTVVVSAEYSFSKRTSVNAIVANNNLTGGYMQETFYTAALGRNPAVSGVQFYGVGINHQF